MNQPTENVTYVCGRDGDGDGDGDRDALTLISILSVNLNLNIELERSSSSVFSSSTTCSSLCSISRLIPWRLTFLISPRRPVTYPFRTRCKMNTLINRTNPIKIQQRTSRHFSKELPFFVIN